MIIEGHSAVFYERKGRCQSIADVDAVPRTQKPGQQNQASWIGMLLEQSSFQWQKPMQKAKDQGNDFEHSVVF